ncbi:MAG TPA: glutamate mutase L [Roseiflexaceae bacterium]|nr:glutamate mutase L [Roseiflexaceae bacterium]
MPLKPSARLVAEVGSVTTRVTLVDTVDGEARLIGQASVPSTTEPPYENAVIGILEAATQLSETTGRQLMRDGSLLMPQTAERDGVDTVVGVTSAGAPMGVVIAAVSSEVSARSALRASRATYTNLLQTVTLDDAAGVAAGNDSSWIERQVQTLLSLQPDLVIIAGGLEDGATESLVRLAHIVALTAFSSRIDDMGQQRQDISRRTVIFAGNSQAREAVIEALSGRADLSLVENVRPSLEVERLEPARQAVVKFYNETFLPNVPGAQALRRLSRAPLSTSCDATGLITRFIAARDGRDTLVLDAGSASSAAYLASQGRYTPAIRGGVGTGYGLGGVLAERGVAAIARWLPFPIGERDLTHWLLNKMLRPQTLPVTREDVLIEQAIAREALSIAFAALRDERPSAPYDYVLAGGGVLANAPHPGLAALSLLDALQPRADDTVRLVELHLDTLGLIPACGALAFSDPDAALALFEHDLLRNAPLATCVVALGGGRPGEAAVEAEIKEVGGETRRIVVQHGQIGRLALRPGRSGTLMVQPTDGVRIGSNPAGKQALSNPGEIRGSALGVIIDARGRPLRLPDDPLTRQQQLWDWLVALGVESGPLPYGTADPLPPMSMPTRSTNGSITFVESSAPAVLSAPPPQPGEADVPQALDRDLAKLRQTVEEPKKGGFLRRKG